MVLLGDLNYRIAMDNDEARQLVRARKWSMLLESDELLLELSKGQRFDGWHEGLVNLRPDLQVPPQLRQVVLVDGRRRRQGPPSEFEAAPRAAVV